MPTFTGTNPERQSVGDPGHCEPCAEVGHVKAHPDLGCGDVGCYAHHDEPPAVCPSCGSDDCPTTWGKPCPTRKERLRTAFMNDLQDVLQRAIDNGVDVHAIRISIINPDCTVAFLTVDKEGRLTL